MATSLRLNSNQASVRPIMKSDMLSRILADMCKPGMLVVELLPFGVFFCGIGVVLP